jgi:hypothetical protein
MGNNPNSVYKKVYISERHVEDMDDIEMREFRIMDDTKENYSNELPAALYKLMKWHHRCGHLSMRRIKELAERGILP